MEYKLSKRDEDAIQAFQQAQEKKHGPEFASAIGGGRYTFLLRPTSIGTICLYQCFCGDSLDLSDYESW